MPRGYAMSIYLYLNVTFMDTESGAFAEMASALTLWTYGDHLRLHPCPSTFTEVCLDAAAPSILVYAVDQGLAMVAHISANIVGIASKRVARASELLTALHLSLGQSNLEEDRGGSGIGVKLTRHSAPIDFQSTHNLHTSTFPGGEGTRHTSTIPSAYYSIMP